MTVAERVAAISERIEAASVKCGGGPNGVHLLAAVKERLASEIEEAIGAGVEFIGENKVQEGEAHFSSISPQARAKTRCHFIGRLQSNKVKKAAALFDSIDSVDSPELARRIQGAAEELGVFRDCMVEVNLGEEQKGGAAFSDIPSLCEAIYSCPRLTLTGLMGIPPFFDEPGKSRPYFRRLYKLFGEMKKNHPDPEKFRFLSMGMSGDFEAAIEEGSNMVRIGTLLFGPRRQK